MLSTYAVITHSQPTKRHCTQATGFNLSFLTNKFFIGNYRLPVFAYKLAARKGGSATTRPTQLYEPMRSEFDSFSTSLAAWKGGSAATRATQLYEPVRSEFDLFSTSLAARKGGLATT